VAALKNHNALELKHHYTDALGFFSIVNERISITDDTTLIPMRRDLFFFFYYWPNSRSVRNIYNTRRLLVNGRLNQLCTTVTHPITDLARRCLTASSVIGRETVFTTWHIRSQIYIFYNIVEFYPIIKWDLWNYFNNQAQNFCLLKPFQYESFVDNDSRAFYLLLYFDEKLPPPPQLIP
jgi:hypothetical protein